MAMGYYSKCHNRLVGCLSSTKHNHMRDGSLIPERPYRTSNGQSDTNLNTITLTSDYQVKEC